MSHSTSLVPMTPGITPMTPLLLSKYQFDTSKLEATRDDYDLALLTELAEAILAEGNLARPIIVRHSHIDPNVGSMFEILQGEAMYHAAILATEINPRWELINVLVVEAPSTQSDILRRLNRKRRNNR
ncbi:MAG: hypothetical protein SAJ12_09345 [Jaaginema sp. PMC 1079.18]|nr:hypothetical protein [Jaaginema sp. PMC 1080.18]MEC4851205.1 hypothetical protein [Jaaginema sp. PMC 1079.18]MEC4867022.1 hypothetical protein [Jaaginema sp. PMC 1078.18]